MKKSIGRRQFIKGLGVLSLILGLDTAFGQVGLEILEKGEIKRVEARYYRKLKREVVQCLLCPRRCILRVGQRGVCRVRENLGGKLCTLVYGTPCIIHRDPVEKSPLYHFLPNSRCLSLATAGCNLRCLYCQNWQISQAGPEETTNYALSPKQVVDMAVKIGCRSISYTYAEPVIFYEYVYDTAKLAKARGLRNIMVTGAYINAEPLRALCKYVDGFKVDLKGFDEKYYEEICGGKREPVLAALKVLKEEGVWFEVVNLLISPLNDGEGEVNQLVEWIKAELGDEVPVAFTRFYPTYKLRNLPATPVASLERARRIAENLGLKYVYVGNVPGHPGESTYCDNCNKLLIKRNGFQILENSLRGGKCRFCGNAVPGVWS